MDRSERRFLWGVAGAGHQIEGANTASDYWVAENVTGSMFAEPSGGACDHYARFAADIDLLAELGYSCYRFSVEWSWVEPAEGRYDQAALDHYGQMVERCRHHGIEAIVTYNHFTCPAWFAGRGGWHDAGSVDRFDRYCAVVAAALGDRVGWACTFNEPNVGVQLREDGIFPAEDRWPEFDWQRQAARLVGGEQFSLFPIGPTQPGQGHLLEAHARAVATIRAVNPRARIGMTLAVQDYQSVDDEVAKTAAASRTQAVDVYLDATGDDDFVGVQTYTRAVYDRSGPVEPRPDIERTQMGYEFFPEALGGAIRYVAARSGKPVFVTENGVATEDDSRRVEYLDRAVASMRAAMADGVEVVGYCHWSIFDNYEWIHGYRPHFGVIGVDRATQQRDPKPSAYRLAAYARGTA